MKKNLLLLFLFLSVAVVSCDITDDDVEATPTQIFVKEIGSTSTRVDSYLTAGANYLIVTTPKQGIAEIMPTLNGVSLLTFKPTSKLTGSDVIGIRSINASGNVVEEKNFELIAIVGCGRGNVVDTVYMTGGTTQSVNLLADNFYCGITPTNALIDFSAGGSNNGTITTEFNKANGTLNLTYQSVSGKRTEKYISYTIGVNPSADLNTSTVDWKKYPGKFERFRSGIVVFNVDF